MKKIEDFKEFMDLWNINHKNRYWGFKKISKEQEQDIIERANISDFKRYNIYMLDDGYYLVMDTKWSIDRDLYYDDELDAPEITFSYFEYKNRMNIKYDELTDVEYYRPYFMINYNNTKEVCVVRGRQNYDSNLEYYKDKGLFVRFLTDDEIKQYNDIVTDLKIKYQDRLANYFKKYRDKIYAVGYWANR